MSSNFVEEQNKGLSDHVNNKEKQAEAKKSLKNVLSSFMKKKHLDEKSLEKMKKEFLNIKNNMNTAKTSYETLMDIQKKLSKIYKNLNDDEETSKK